MKVIIVHNAYPHYGGEDTVVENEIQMLQRNGIEAIPWIVPTKMSGIIHLIRCAISALWNPISYLKFKRFLHKEKPDLVHCHNTFPLLSPSLFTACYHTKTPVVQTIHNYRHICPAGSLFRDGQICEQCLQTASFLPSIKYGCYRNSRLASIVPALTNYIQKRTAIFERQISALIALNPFGKQKLAQGGLPSDKILIKPNFCPDLTTHAQFSPTKQLQYSFCFTGRLSEEKGIHHLLDAWSRLKHELPRTESAPPHLFIAGAGNLEPLVKKAALNEPTIHYQGSLTHVEAVNLIASSDCLICPSIWYEGMPMTIIEAFCAGVPVIASNIGGLPDMIDHGRNGLLTDPGNIGKLTDALLHMYRNPQHPQMKKEARSTYENRHAEKDNVTLLKQLYNEVIHAHNQTST